MEVNILNEQVKKLRKALGLTLEKFGAKLGVGKTAINKIENGTNSLTEQMIISICNISWNGRFVNEQWLRTGEGNMFSDISDKEAYFNAATDLSSDPLIVSALIEYQRLTDKEKAVISQYAVSVLNRLKEYE